MVFTRYFFVGCLGAALVSVPASQSEFWPVAVVGAVVMFFGGYLDGMAAQRRHDRGDWRA